LLRNLTDTNGLNRSKQFFPDDVGARVGVEKKNAVALNRVLNL
jgi:hypothetical protein